MPDSRNYITHYVKYFNLRAPSSLTQGIIFVFLGAVFGGSAALLVYQNVLSSGFVQILVFGISTGMLVVSLPALLTVAFIKSVKRKLLLKHAMLATLIVTVPYAVLLFLNSFIFTITKSTVFAYIFLLLINLGIFGYWILMGKFVLNRSKSAVPIAVVQPLLNILFYIPLGTYLLSFQVPLSVTLAKLFAGMFVFMVVVYAFLYLLDRPSKKILEASGAVVLTSMLSQWLFSLTHDVKVIGYDAGTKRDLSVDILALKGSKKYKGIFVNPDIHFGPFQGVGGSMAPMHMGKVITKNYGAAPFIIHSPLDIQDNPISSSEVYTLTNKIEKALGNGMRFDKAYGDFNVGEDGVCKAINITVGKAGMFLLTKAPYVTEDISRDVGIQLRQFAEDATNRNAIMIDAHNTRFESASERELDGIQAGSAYIRKYENAIRKSAQGISEKRVHFGAASKKIAPLLKWPKDLGDGYTSVGVFKFGKRKFCLVYFDANNMLPGFRERLLEHIRNKFKMRVEFCTTDTHWLNSISSSASNSLGRYTKVHDMIPILDMLIENAIKDMEPVSYAYKNLKVENFPIWGEKADMLIERTSREVRRMLKYIGPLFVIIAFVVAAWVIYIV